MCFIRRFLMRKAKKLSLTLMASVMALGVIAFTAQPANASYGYKYTDSIRPPVLTPTPSTGRAAPAAKTTTTVEPTKAAGSVTTANTTNNTDKTAQDILSSLLSLLQNLFNTLFK